MAAGATDGRMRQRELRVLILAPVGRDAQLMAQVLEQSRIKAHVVRNMNELCDELTAGAGTVILADEALQTEAMNQCLKTVSAQPSWSDIPIIVLTTRDYANRTDTLIAEQMRPLGHVTILERPVRVATLVSATSAALRSRVRQYDVRDNLEDLRRAEQEIRFTNEQLSAARDAALEASRLKSRFLANMSHELRTPLNAVLGYAEMIRDEAESKQNGELFTDSSRIIEASRHLLALINDILDLAKVEAGRMTLAFEAFDVADLVRHVKEIVMPLVERNANSLTVDCPDDIGAMVADEAKIRQCLLNLLSNACKFTVGGKIELGGRRETDEMGVDWIVFWVRDSGIGMSQADLGKLFTEFVQLDSSYTRTHGGTGLGLALTRRFAELMRGGLFVESQVGRGSTFSMRLPAKAHAREAVEVSSSEAEC